eukprot:COSAG02_NODE_59082_length_275_cov_0.744318_1_plen_56_part_01
MASVCSHGPRIPPPQRSARAPRLALARLATPLARASLLSTPRLSTACWAQTHYQLL